MTEIELKFLLDEGGASQLRSRLMESALAEGAPRTRKLRSVYYDTHDHALKKAGIALRLRRDGRRWVQTVKTKGKIHGGLMQTGEFECPAPGGRLSVAAIPDVTTRDAVAARIRGEPLRPVCETVIERTASELTLADGARAELSIDVGEIHAGTRKAAFREAEIELIEGGPAALYDFARRLFPEGGLRFSEMSKAARGYLLAEKGRIDLPLAPRKAEEVKLDPGQTAEEAARTVLRECFAQIADNAAVVRACDDPEGPHQLRIGLRRLRSALSVFADPLRSPERTRLGAEARWLGQEVGRLRDLDVALIDIVRPEAGAHGDEPGFSALAATLERESGAVRAEVRRTLAGARAQAFLIDLARFTEARGWFVASDRDQPGRLAEPVAGVAARAMHRRWKKARRRARGIASLDVAARHELRKELKRLRYAAEFLCPLYPDKRTDPFLRRLKKLQTVFGDLNDAAMISEMFSGPGAPASKDPGAQRAAGRIIGARLERADAAWAGAQALWRSLARTPPFWK